MLKWIAVITMVTDHLAAIVLKGYVNIQASRFSKEGLEQMQILYDWMRRIGRTAFPLFAFLLVEGFFHTGSRKKYRLRLLLFAVLSEIPYDLAVFGSICRWKTQNTLFTLLLGFVILELAERIEVNAWRRSVTGGRFTVPGQWVFLFQAALFAAGAALAWMCRLDYSYRGIALLAVFYFFHRYRISAAAAGYCIFLYRPWSFPAFLLILLYNGKRGGKGRKWFYLFYPVHLFVLYGIRCIMDFCVLS